MTQWRRRHKDELDRLKGEVRRRVEEYAISDRVNRIRDAQLRRDLLVAVQEARARGETGENTGIVVKTYRNLGSGENSYVVEEYKVDVAFLAEWRANERYVSEELGQLSKGEDGLSISGSQVVIVRDVPEMGL